MFSGLQVRDFFFYNIQLHKKCWLNLVENIELLFMRLQKIQDLLKAINYL